MGIAIPNLTIVDSWAEEELGDADLGDVRLDRRLVELALILGQRPAASLPQAAQDPALLKAAYRFFDNDSVTETAILASHVAATYDRIASVPIVFAVNDTSFLDWTSHPATTGLGPLATDHQQGLVLHSTQVITPTRVPLGVLSLKIWARDPETYGALKDHKTRPITEKESQKWLDSLTVTNLAHDAAPQTTMVFLADAEADVYDLFIAERRTGVELLVRAGQDRAVDHSAQRLWPAMQTARIAGTVTVAVAARPAMPAGPGQPAKAAQAAREATMQVRFGPLTLKPPAGRAREKLAQVAVWGVWAVEIGAPVGVDPVEWMLLTTVAVETPGAAMERLAWYRCRWGIEVWHKALKSGCRIEARQLETAARLKRCLALFSVIAWRIVYTTMLARAVPDAPCTAILEEDEWKALYVRIKRTREVPATPPTLGEAVGWLAQVGGFQGRKGDGKPGMTVMWKGFQELAPMLVMYQIMRDPIPPSRPGSRKTQHVGND